jgi:hypothetical protein
MTGRNPGILARPDRIRSCYGTLTAIPSILRSTPVVSARFLSESERVPSLTDWLTGLASGRLPQTSAAARQL